MSYVHFNKTCLGSWGKVWVIRRTEERQTRHVMAKLTYQTWILDWSNRSGTTRTTTMSRPGRGVMRKMTKERRRVVDFPDTRTIRMTDDELNILIGNEIPGKVITAGMYFLTTWPRQSPIKRRRKSTDKGGEDRTSKRKRTDPVEGLTECYYLDLSLIP
jgi:hypothetical protein